ncbi:flavin reductase family protein [Caulobacter sp. S45]|uniref:flavin reductase family protein n=1 Tax=Caulobacter sp. S45 TaxID=1641861 RepID=UPI001575FCE5|nr:flavin reductase family protein [Caulobacter sp. S45]
MDALKQALRRLAKAVVVITSRYEGRRYAMAATAVSELSFDPPSMLICVNRTASLYAPLAGGAPFAINILHHSQSDIAAICAGRLKGEARFATGDWPETDLAVPRLGAAQASIVCRNVKQVDYGTHGIFIGDVVEVYMEGLAEPLVYVDGRYTRAMDADATII